MRIRVERSGGFAGLVRTADVDTATLPADLAREIDERLRAIDFAAAGRAADAESRPDAFQYDVLIDDRGAQQRATFREPNLPADFRALFKRLLELTPMSR